MIIILYFVFQCKHVSVSTTYKPSFKQFITRKQEFPSKYLISIIMIIIQKCNDKFECFLLFCGLIYFVGTNICGLQKTCIFEDIIDYRSKTHLCHMYETFLFKVKYTCKFLLISSSFSSGLQAVPFSAILLNKLLLSQESTSQ